MRQLSRFSVAGQIGAFAAAVLAVAALTEWGLSRAVVTRAVAIEAQNELNTRASMVGSYRVTGTDPDGMPYKGTHVVDISLAASGALELDWDNGRQIGIGHVVGDVLAVGFLSRGRTAILVLKIDPDGSLSGTWLRRTDRGSQGTEVWTRISGATAALKGLRPKETNVAEMP